MEEGTENLTSNTENLNITGHTCQINSIAQLGNNPEQWLDALRDLEKIANGPRKRRILQHFFMQSSKNLDSTSLRHNKHYALLLAEEALFYGEVDAEDARSTFQLALTLCQKSPLLYILFAQFELDQGRKNKALKILGHGEVCVEDRSEIVAAKEKIEKGKRIDDGVRGTRRSLPLQNITNTNKENISLKNQKPHPLDPKKSRNPSGSAPEPKSPTEKLSLLDPLPMTPKLPKCLSEVPAVPNPKTPNDKMLPLEPQCTTPQTPVLTSEKLPYHEPPTIQNLPKPPKPVLEQDTTPQPPTTLKAPVERVNDSHKTPVQSSVSYKHLLDMDLKSPESPNLSYYSSKKTLPPSNLASDTSLTQSMSKPKTSLTEFLSSTETSAQKDVGGSVQPADKFRSAKKTSTLLSNYRSTGQKPMRVLVTRGSQPPRRVLVADARSSWDSDDDSDHADVKPLPDEKQDKLERNAPEGTHSKPPLPSRVPQNGTTIPEKNKENHIPAPQNDHNKENERRQTMMKENDPPSNPPQENVVTGAHMGVNRRVPEPNNSHFNYPTPSFSHLSQTKDSGPFQPRNTPNVQPPSANGCQNNHNYPPNINTPGYPTLTSSHNSYHHTPSNPNSLCDLGTVPRGHVPLNQVTSSHTPPLHPPPLNSHHLRHANPQMPPGATFCNHPLHKMFQEKKINGVSYVVLQMLGKGGSSKVYQVFNPATTEISAVKQVNLNGCEPSVLEGYKNEIEFLKKLQGSRYIIKLRDYEIRNNYLFLVMECGSIDLSALLKKHRAEGSHLEILDIMFFWKNMLKAVETIHKHGVIHLDLKPANFMLVNYSLKLIDFGIANSIQVDATSIIKDTQFGTLNYMAPETINDMSGGAQYGSSYAPKFKVGPKADVWALGCILYNIMYGKTPFQHIHHQAMKLCAITNEKHKIEFPDFPRKEFVEIVQACLTRDPKKRPSVEMLLDNPLLK